MNADNEYIETSSNEASNLASAAQSEQFDDENLAWTFTEPDTSTGKAVAIPTNENTNFVGPNTFTVTDLTQSSRLDNFSISRSYSSVQTKDRGMGLGWDIVPYRIHVTQLPTGQKVYANIYTPQGRIVFDDFGTIGGSTPAIYDSEAFAQTQSWLAHSAQGYTLVIDQQEVAKFDTEGRLIEEILPSGSQKFYSYTGDNLTLISNSGDSRSFTLRYTGDKISEIETSTGRINQYSYDSNGNLSQVTDPFGNTTSYQYTDNLLTQILDTTGSSQQTFTYDSLNRVSTTSSNGQNYSVNINQTAGEITITDPDNRTATIETDDQNRPSKITNVLNESTSLSYDGEVGPTQIIDPKGNQYTATYDSRGRVKTQTSPLGESVTYYYLGLDQIQGIDRSSGLDTHYVYNENNQITSIIENIVITPNQSGSYSYTSTPETIRTNLVYDQYGQLVEVKKQSQTQVQISYDEVGRQLQTTLPDGQSVSYSYSPTDELVSSNTGNLTTSYGYQDGRLSTITAPSGSLSISYDSLGQISQVTDATQSTYQFTRDADGNLISQNSPSNHTHSYRYTNYSELSEVTLAGGQNQTYEYDSLGRLTKVSHLTNGITPNAPAGALEPLAFDFTLAETITPDQGETISIPISVQNTSNQIGQSLILLIEVQTPSGNIIETSHSNLTIPAYGSISRNIQVTASEQGEYKVMAGVYTQFWAESLDWEPNVGNFIVEQPEPIDIVSDALITNEQVTQGSTVSFDTTVSNITNTEVYDALIYVETVSPTGTIQQSIHENIDLIPSQTITVPVSVNVPESGVYTVKIGVFTQSWQELIHWNSTAGYLVTGQIQAEFFTSDASGYTFEGSTNLLSFDITYTNQSTQSASDVQLYVEVIAPDGTISIYFQEQVSILSGETYQFPIQQTLDQNGTYKIKAGVFTNSWNTLIVWNDTIGNYTR